MRALVTGAAGFIGGHVAAALAAEGAEVRAFDRQPPPALPPGIDFVAGDLLDPAALARALEGCDAVFHLAALYSYDRDDADAMRAVNVEGTRLLLDAVARGADRRRVVHTSSCGTCGPVRGRAATEGDAPPEWELSVPYKRTKVDGERLAMSAAKEGLDVVVVNPTTPVGPGDRRPTPTGKMVADVARGRARAHLAGGALNVVAVEDVATGHLLAHGRGRPGERYLLGGENLSMREVFAHRGERRGAPAAEDGRPVVARQRRGPGRRRRARDDRAKAVAPRPRRGSACPRADDVRRFQGKAGARISLPAGGRGAGRRGTGRAGLPERRFLTQFAEWRLAESRPLR